ncbi:MAG: hypothetical protein ACRCVU_05050 [Flavobacterium sp.]
MYIAVQNNEVIAEGATTHHLIDKIVGYKLVPLNGYYYLTEVYIGRNKLRGKFKTRIPSATVITDSHNEAINTFIRQRKLIQLQRLGKCRIYVEHTSID